MRAEQRREAERQTKLKRLEKLNELNEGKERKIIESKSWQRELETPKAKSLQIALKALL